MTRKILLGAPSLVGKDANDLGKDGFANAVYPIKMKITNHMPRDIALPEVRGLFLRSVFYPGDNQKIVEITTEDQMKRMISSVEQICELNQYEKALTIEEVEDADSDEQSGEASDSVSDTTSDEEQSLVDQDNTAPTHENLTASETGIIGKKSKTHKRGK